MLGTLYVIATPIGNLEDITLRALAVLPTLDVLFCEDTRMTSRLLARHGLRVTLDSYREQAHERKAARLIELLEEGKQVGLVSDAGTPAVSDPGTRLVAAVAERLPEARIVPLPGPSAAVALASVSGFGGEGYLFAGFPPHKKGRAKWLGELLDVPRMVILYESPHRIERLLGELVGLIPTRRLVVGRELTKLHETIYRGTPAEVLAQLGVTSRKGEFAVIIDRAERQ
jgi:16S rRNA (cytidine1402-2'-O)-methyltransferase